MNVCWITSSAFLDVDISLIPMFHTDINITWFVFLYQDSFYSKDFLEDYIKKTNINCKIVVFSDRLRSYSTFMQYLKILNEIKSINFDIYYFNELGMPYFVPLLFFKHLDSKKIIFTCHDFIEHERIKHGYYFKIYKKFIFRLYENFHLYSQTQKDLFDKVYPHKKSFFIPLCLKDFGKSNLRKNDEKITFLFFGTIRENKGINILLNAINKIPPEKKDKICVRIYGNTDKWDVYERIIENKSIYDLQIRRINNEEIPDLFQTSHYLILPYMDVTQSGPLLISYNYNVPVIATDLPGFREYVENGKNGFLFKYNNSEDLSKVIMHIIDCNNYQEIQSNLKTFVDNNISLKVLADRYVTMFYEISGVQQ